MERRSALQLSLHIQALKRIAEYREIDRLAKVLERGLWINTTVCAKMHEKKYV